MEIVKLLVDKGANVNERDEYGHTALIGAASHGAPDVVRYLIEKGADVNAIWTVPPFNIKYTALSRATAQAKEHGGQNYYAIIDLLKKAGAKE